MRGEVLTTIRYTNRRLPIRFMFHPQNQTSITFHCHFSCCLYGRRDGQTGRARRCLVIPPTEPRSAASRQTGTGDKLSTACPVRRTAVVQSSLLIKPQRAAISLRPARNSCDSEGPTVLLWPSCGFLQSQPERLLSPVSITRQLG